MSSHSVPRFVESAIFGQVDDDKSLSSTFSNTRLTSADRYRQLVRLRAAVVILLLVGMMTIVGLAVSLDPWPVGFLVAAGAATVWCWWIERRSAHRVASQNDRRAP